MTAAKTLILVFHPALARSKANAALATAAAALPDTDVVDMQALYPDGVVDADREVARLLAADRIVLQFPIYWYSTPPLLKAWQDAVLTRMYYIAYEAEGRRLEGTPILVAATAGNQPDAYSPTGRNLFPLETLLSPLQATAYRCGLPWASPFLVYRSGALTDAERAEAAELYAARIEDWRCEMPGRPVVTREVETA